MHADEVALYIFRPEKVEPILVSDPAFYGSSRESMVVAIQRVSPDRNGELLGYGARTQFSTPYKVAIHEPGNLAGIYAAFTCELATADRFGQERTAEIADYVGHPLTYTIVDLSLRVR